MKGVKWIRPAHLDEDYIICYKCKTWVKIGDEIHRNKAKRRGVADNCKACDQGPQKKREAEYRRKRREALAVLKDKPCDRCGLMWPPFVMDWHHRVDEVKSFTIAQSHRKTKLLPLILEEIEKCDLLCSNCHRIKHFEEGTQGRNQYS